MSNKYTISELIIESIKVHGDLYDYRLITKYVNNKTKLPIICSEHGLFYQSLNSHLKGRGCPMCGKISMSISQALTTDDFIYKAVKKHGYKYDYSRVTYINNRTKLEIICKRCNQPFLQTGNDHLDGCGCPNCQVGGFNINKRAILYYLSILGGTAYKVGITNRTVEERFTSNELSKIKIINLIQYQYGRDAYLTEQHILKEFSYAKWTGDNLLDSGNNELFNYDILGLDND